MVVNKQSQSKYTNKRVVLLGIIFFGGFMDPKIVNTAVEVHGHFAPSLVLGLRMSEIALSILNANRGDKALIGISEMELCLPDSLQIATGCTLGRRRIFIENYGKLALTLANSQTRQGVRVALKEEAKNYSDLMNKWTMRLGKLNHEEEADLRVKLLDIDEKYFLIQRVQVNKNKNSDKPTISVCSNCKEPFSSDLATLQEDRIYCRSCSGDTYYKPT